MRRSELYMRRYEYKLEVILLLRKDLERKLPTNVRKQNRHNKDKDYYRTRCVGQSVIFGAICMEAMLHQQNISYYSQKLLSQLYSLSKYP